MKQNSDSAQGLCSLAGENAQFRAQQDRLHRRERAWMIVCIDIFSRRCTEPLPYLSRINSSFLQNSELFGIIQNNDALLELDALNFHAHTVYEY